MELGEYQKRQLCENGIHAQTLRVCALRTTKLHLLQSNISNLLCLYNYSSTNADYIVYPPNPAAIIEVTSLPSHQVFESRTHKTYL